MLSNFIRFGFIAIILSLMLTGCGTSSDKQSLTPEQKVDKDLETIVIKNVVDLSHPKVSHLTFKNDTDHGTYEVEGVVSGVDASGKNVKYDFSAFSDGSNTIQWTTENTTTYKVETGTVDTSAGLVKTMK